MMAIHEDQSGNIIAASVISATTSVFFAITRIYSNKVLLRRYHQEDWIIALASTLLTTGCTIVGIAVKSGYGRHIDTLTIQQRIDCHFWFVLSTWPTLLSIAVPKLAVVGLLCRVFNPGRWTRSFLWAVAVLGVMNFLVEAAFSTFQCIPIQARWDIRIRDARCVSPAIFTGFSWYIASYSAAADLILACYPALVFRKMRFDVWKKIGLSFVMGLGIFATGAAVFKVTNLRTLNDDDFTWNQTYLIIGTVTEAAIIISASCIPVLHPLYDQVLGVLRKLLFGHHRSPLQRRPPVSATPATQEVSKERVGFWTARMRLAMGSLGKETSSCPTLRDVLSVSGVETQLGETTSEPSKQKISTALTNVKIDTVISTESKVATYTEEKRSSLHGADNLRYPDFITVAASALIPVKRP